MTRFVRYVYDDDHEPFGGCDTCGGTGRWETTFEEAPTDLVDIGPCPDCAGPLPFKRIVCPRCKGTGCHVNPSIDGNGISTDDECWQDDDFREMYLSGGYDVICERCDGIRVIEVVDFDGLDPEVETALHAWSREMAELAHMEAHT